MMPDHTMNLMSLFMLGLALDWLVRECGVDRRHARSMLKVKTSSGTPAHRRRNRGLTPANSGAHTPRWRQVCSVLHILSALAAVLVVAVIATQYSALRQFHGSFGGAQRSGKSFLPSRCAARLLAAQLVQRHGCGSAGTSNRAQRQTVMLRSIACTPSLRYIIIYSIVCCLVRPCSMSCQHRFGRACPGSCRQMLDSAMALQIRRLRPTVMSDLIKPNFPAM